MQFCIDSIIMSKIERNSNCMFYTLREPHLSSTHFLTWLPLLRGSWEASGLGMSCFSGELSQRAARTSSGGSWGRSQGHMQE